MGDTPQDRTHLNRSSTITILSMINNKVLCGKSTI